MTKMNLPSYFKQKKTKSKRFAVLSLTQTTTTEYRDP